MKLLFAVLAAGTIAVYSWNQPAEPAPAPMRESLETNKLKSRWFWYMSETRMLPLGAKSIYPELLKQTQAELAKNNICPKQSYTMGTTWETCNGIHKP